MIRAITKWPSLSGCGVQKVIGADGKQHAAEKLVGAGQLFLARKPQAMQLRHFAALHDRASERSSTMVFALPTHLLASLFQRAGAVK